MMESCRICNCYYAESSLLSVHDFNSYGLSYPNMITVLLNLKVKIDTNSLTKICLNCEQKLSKFYEFKSLVQRAEMYHQGMQNEKILTFNNIDDMIDIVDLKIKSSGVVDFKPTLTWKFFEDGSSEIPFNNVIIKRIEPYSLAAEVEVQDTNCKDYESDQNFEDGVETAFDPEFEMSLLDRKKKTNKNFTSKKKNDDSDEDYLEGLTLFPYKKKKHSKYTKKNRVTNIGGAHVNIKPTVLNGYKLIPPPIDPVQKRRRRTNVIETAQICHHCGLLIKNLENHLLLHTGEKKFKCEICDKYFYTIYSLKKHEKKHSDVLYRCDNCVAVFKCKSSLMSHMKVHMNIREYVCQTCSKPFKRKNALRRHLLIHNLANKKYKCDLCSMSFFYNSGLKHHMRIHTGDRPYKCEICSQPYSYKHDFNRHCMNKHGVFLKRRDVRIMNEEVLIREKQLTQDLINKITNINNSNETINPFSGPQAALAFELAVNQLIKDNVILASC